MAIFGRRNPRGTFRKVRESLWPSQGWGRTVHYYRHRLFRTGLSTHSITSGLANGAAVSFTPFLGTHLLQLTLLSWLTRASFIAGLIGTLVGNPWTFSLIFYWAYKTGVWLCGLAGFGGFLALPDDITVDGFLDEPLDFLQFMWAHPLKFLLPMTVGGYACAIMIWPVSYLLLYKPVYFFRRAYRLQRRKRYMKVKERG